MGEQALRDHFAGLALQALITRGGIFDCETDAKVAYEWADAMLKEREKKEDELS